MEGEREREIGRVLPSGSSIPQCCQQLLTAVETENQGQNPGLPIGGHDSIM